MEIGLKCSPIPPLQDQKIAFLIFQTKNVFEIFTKWLTEKADSIYLNLKMNPKDINE